MEKLALFESLPSLGLPLQGDVGLTGDAIIKPRILRIAHGRRLIKPCRFTAEERGLNAYEKHKRSREEEMRRIFYALYKHGFIKRIRLPADTSQGFQEVAPRPWLYGQASWELVCEVANYWSRQLAKEYGGQQRIPGELIWKTEPNQLAERYGWSPHDRVLERSDGFLLHLDKEVSLNVTFVEACRRHGYRIQRWDSDIMVRRRHQREGKKISYQGIDGGWYRGEAIPDGWYEIDSGNPSLIPQVERFFVEIDRDRATKRSRQSNPKHNRKTWETKFRILGRYFGTGLHKKLYQTDAGKVIIITKTYERMTSLKAICEAAGNKGKFWFSYFDLMTPENLFDHAVFWPAGKPLNVRVGLFGKKVTRVQIEP